MVDRIYIKLQTEIQHIWTVVYTNDAKSFKLYFLDSQDTCVYSITNQIQQNKANKNKMFTDVLAKIHDHSYKFKRRFLKI